MNIKALSILAVIIFTSISGCITSDLSNIDGKFGYYNAVNIVFTSSTDSTNFLDVDDMDLAGFKILEEDSNALKPVLQIKKQWVSFFGSPSTFLNFMVLPLKPGKSSTFLILKNNSNSIDTLKISYTSSVYFNEIEEEYRPEYNNVQVEYNNNPTMKFKGFEAQNNILYFSYTK